MIRAYNARACAKDRVDYIDYAEEVDFHGRERPRRRKLISLRCPRYPVPFTFSLLSLFSCACGRLAGRPLQTDGRRILSRRT